MADGLDAFEERLKRIGETRPNGERPKTRIQQAPPPRPTPRPKPSAGPVAIVAAIVFLIGGGAFGVMVFAPEMVFSALDAAIEQPAPIDQ